MKRPGGSSVEESCQIARRLTAWAALPSPPPDGTVRAGRVTRGSCLGRLRSEPAPERREHLGPHLRRVDVADLRVEDAAEAVARPQGLVRAPDSLLEARTPSAGERVQLPGQGEERPGATSRENTFGSKCFSRPFTK